MLSYRTIRPEEERETLLAFFRDTQVASVGYVPEFDEEDHLQSLAQKAAQFPDGYVLVLQDEEPIGSLELRVKPFEGSDVGYISGVYLKPEHRGQGRSQEMFGYAERFFQRLGMTEYHLRVAQENHRALRFYEKQGMEKLMAETNSIGSASWRMRKRLTAQPLNEGVHRVQDALEGMGYGGDRLVELSTSCRTAAEAAESLGCEVLAVKA